MIKTTTNFEFNNSKGSKKAIKKLKKGSTVDKRNWDSNLTPIKHLENKNRLKSKDVETLLIYKDANYLSEKQSSFVVKKPKKKVDSRQKNAEV